MFGARLDLAALNGEGSTKVKRPFTLKRRRSVASVKSEEEEDSTDASSSSSDDSDSDSDSSSSSSDSDTDSSEDSESAGESDTPAKGEPEQAANEDDEDKMDIDVKSSDAEAEKKPSEVNDVEVDEAYVSKHSSIFSKFKQTISKDTEDTEPKELQEPLEPEVLQDLAPLPQPALPRDRILTSKNTHSKNLDWLADAEYSDPANSKSFKEFDLSPIIQSNLEKAGFTSAFSVQIEVLNMILADGKANRLQPDTKGDILVNAATGSGKTLAYSIPLVQMLHNRVVPRVRAVIIVPTKPLINQVFETITEISNGTNLRIVALKTEVPLRLEGSELSSNVPDIIISTPGRLVEHLTNGDIDLKSLQYLVIDEADRLLSQSFQNWAKILMEKIDVEVNISEKWKLGVKKLIFSATLTTDASKLAVLKFSKPRLIIVNDQRQLVNEIFSVPAKLEEYQLRLPSLALPLKPLILAKFLIDTSKLSNVLIFTKSNESSLRLSKMLELLFSKLTPSKPFKVAYLNSTNNNIAVRTSILRDFSEQNINVVVATDLIARGIDVLSITDVINYDLPNSSREYVHRVGRTARAQQAGNAFNFLFGSGETGWFYSIMKQIGRGNKLIEHSDFDYRNTLTDKEEKIYSECLEELQKQVSNA